MFCREVVLFRLLALADHVVTREITLAAHTFGIVRSLTCVMAFSALFKTITLIITGRAHFSRVKFANSGAGGASV